jgi:hypothetical protein
MAKPLRRNGWEIPCAALDDDLVVFDCEALDIVFRRVLIGVTVQGTEAEQRVQDLVRDAANGNFRNLDVARIPVGGRADLQLAVQVSSLKADFLEGDAYLDAGDIVLDRNERFSGAGSVDGVAFGSGTGVSTGRGPFLKSSQRCLTAAWSASDVSTCGISRGVLEVTT